MFYATFPNIANSDYYSNYRTCTNYHTPTLPVPDICQCQAETRMYLIRSNIYCKYVAVNYWTNDNIRKMPLGGAIILLLKMPI